MTTNWADLPAGDELDRLIAERLGWRIELRDGDWCVCDPHNEAYFVTHDSVMDFSDVWERALLIRVPRFSRDTDAALTLLPPPPATVMIYRIEDSNEWGVHVNSISSRLSDHWIGQGETIRLACSRAFLDHTDRQTTTSGD